MGIPLVAVLLVSAYGTGYQVTKVAQHDGGAWLAKGAWVAHSDPAGRVDAETTQRLTDGKSRLRLAQTPTGEVYVTDTASSQTYKIDPTTAAASPVGGTGKAGEVEVVAGPQNAFIVDRARLTVGAIDGRAGRPRPPASGFERIDDVVVDGSGDAWVLDGVQHTVQRVTDAGQTAQTIPTEAGTGARLALAGGHPVLVDPAANQVIPLTGDRARQPIALPEGGDGRVEVNAPSSSGSLWLAYEDTGRLVRVDMRSGRASAGDLPGNGADLGAAVEHQGRLYVPVYDRHRVLVLDAGSLQPARDPVEVDGNSADFDVFANNDRVWINDPYARRGAMIEPDGDERELDKGDGPGLTDSRDDAPAHHDPAPTPPNRPQPEPDPEPGSDAEQPRVEVPRLTGEPVEQACDALGQLGLSCRKVAVPAPGDERPGTVIGLDPPPGTRLRPGRVVEVRHVEEGRSRDGQPTRRTPSSESPSAPPDADAPPDAAPAPAAPAQVAVPAVVGVGVFDACGAVQAAGLVCTTAPTKAAAAPFVIYGQSPPAGTPVAPGSAVTVQYDDTQPATLFRIKRYHTNVWVIGTDQAHIQELMASGNYIDQATLGQAYPCCTRGVGHLRSIWSFKNASTPHRGDNRYYSANPTPPGPNWEVSGEVGQVLAEAVEGTVPLYRVAKHHDGTADFSYATPTDLAYYQSHNYQIDETIGWIWP